MPRFSIRATPVWCLDALLYGAVVHTRTLSCLSWLIGVPLNHPWSWEQRRAAASVPPQAYSRSDQYPLLTSWVGASWV
jgi:hypothetical protein